MDLTEIDQILEDSVQTGSFQIMAKKFEISRQVITNYEASGAGPAQLVVTIARTLDQALTIQRTLDWPSRLDRTLKAKKD